jgi:hypothetical protein
MLVAGSDRAKRIAELFDPPASSASWFVTSLHVILFMPGVVPALAADLPINPAVTKETIATTICAPGWTKTIRPSARYTARIKIKLVRELEIPEELLVDFELDHRIPLALGGAPSDPRNLELQPWDEAGERDRIEACLSRAVCAGTITLDEARRRIWTDLADGREGLPMRDAFKWRRTAFTRIDGAVDIAEDDWSLRIGGLPAARIYRVRGGPNDGR